MENQAISEQILSFIRKNLLIIILIVAGLICLGYGLISLFDSSNSQDDITIGTSDNSISASKIMADVEGAVIKPGVYELSGNARIQDLIIVSGGFSQNADREWISKNINLASKVSDGAKVYIPKAGEKSGSTGSTASQTNLININSATSQELDSLSGIGPATAEKLIQNRPYQTLDELVSKKVLTSKVFETIKDKISIY
jgi:competence protein ComEA